MRGGRAVAGVGSGGRSGLPEHYIGFGVPYAESQERFREALAIMREAWKGKTFSFQGKYFHVDNATVGPRPVQQPHPPIWIGASGEKRMMPIAARHADVWHCFGPVKHLGPKSGRLSAMAEDAGRDPSEILRAASLSLEDDWDEMRATVDAWRDAGFGYLVCGWPPQGADRVKEFAERFLS